jgi:hypothetical protein
LAIAAAQSIVTITSAKVVVPFTPAYLIVTSFTEKKIVSGVSIKCIIAIAALKFIVVCATVQTVCAYTTKEEILAIAAAQSIVAFTSAKVVVAGPPVNGVIAQTGINGIITAIAVDNIIVTIGPINDVTSAIRGLTGIVIVRPHHLAGVFTVDLAIRRWVVQHIIGIILRRQESVSIKRGVVRCDETEAIAISDRKGESQISLVTVLIKSDYLRKSGFARRGIGHFNLRHRVDDSTSRIGSAPNRHRIDKCRIGARFNVLNKEV